MTLMFMNNYETGKKTAYLFNKKRLIKVLAGLGISNWKEFLKSEYTSDDTEQVIEAFELNGWNYRKLLDQEV